MQPGSLGIEAMLELLQLHMLERGLAVGIPEPRFEPIALDAKVAWKYRGQVLPTSRRAVVELEVLEVSCDGRGALAIADAWLRVDGKRIYSASRLGMRIVPGAPAAAMGASAEPVEGTAAEEILDPAVDRWLGDHRPTYTIPVLPFMCVADRLAAAALARAPVRRVVALRDMRVPAWIALDRPRRLRTEARVRDEAEGELDVTLLAWREAQDPALSRFEPVASGTVILADDYPPAPSPPAALEDASDVEDPYAAGALFHGPAFHVVRRLRAAPGRAAALLEAGAGAVPRGALHPALLDAAFHVIHEDLGRWSPEIPADHVGYPVRLAEMTLHGPVPASGEVRCEVRFDGFDGDARHPAFQVHLLAGDEVRVAFRVVEALLPAGPLGAARGAARRAFFGERAFVPGLGLSRFEGEATRLALSQVAAMSWVPGGIGAIYGIAGDAADLEALARAIAVKDHVAQRARVHPATVEVPASGEPARCASIPLATFPFHARRVGGNEILVTDAARED